MELSFLFTLNNKLNELETDNGKNSYCDLPDKSSLN
jgi:hypothetical protein